MPEELVFKSEDERVSALQELPVEPPPGIDLDAWNAEQNEKQDRIMRAKIDSGASPSEPPAPEAPAEPSPSAPVDQPGESSGDERLFFGKYKVADLPEPLRKYAKADDPEKAMLDQLAHARKYADETEKKYQELTTEQKILKDKLVELEKERDEAKKQTRSPELTAAQRSASQSHIDDLTASIESLKKLSDDDIISPKDVRPALEKAFEKLAGVSTEFGDYRQKTEARIEELTKKLEENAASQKTISDEILETKQSKQYNAAMQAIGDLQGEHPELKTSKPIADVESNLFRIAEKIAGRQVDHDLFNRIINAYIRNEKEVVDICQEKGVLPEEYGISKDDIEKYAIIANIDATTKGQQIDPLTGKRQDLTNFLGNKISFPSYDAAYNYLLNKNDVLKKRHQEELVAAEKRGQQNLEKALGQRAQAPVTLGNDGAASPDALGAELTEAQAAELAGFKKGPRTIDQEKMEVAARMGNREPFKLYNKALKRLGLPEENPSKDWPAELVKA